MRYLIFAGSAHYPQGGCGDLVQTADSPKDAQKHFNECVIKEENDWVHILDTTTMRCIHTYPLYSHPLTYYKEI